ncbi:hypothetical protein ACWD0A_30800 [Streptomyces sp. NPDC002867]
MSDVSDVPAVPAGDPALRSQAVPAVGTVKRYVNFCSVHATLRAP